jgi:arylsulfatase A
MIGRRTFLKDLGLSAGAILVSGCHYSGKLKRYPNIILIFCDDLGYGDIGCFGSTKHRTPNIDKIALEGRRLTSFYVTSGVCTPSRASLLTGCYPRRVNMHEDSTQHWVLLPIAKKGLDTNEQTIAEILKIKNYSTACIGKWHLGDQPEFLPTEQGFDYYFGIPYSNDMGPNPSFPDQPPLPLLRNEKIIEAPADQNSITQRYTEETVKFINENKDKPFFLYLAHTMPHVPIHVSEKFRGKSANGIYGDAVEEIDWSTGEILRALEKSKLDNETLIIFTSDNGAQRGIGGSNSPFSGWKGSTLEGGMRVPCVLRWPDKIPAGTKSDVMCSTLDFLPTFAKLIDVDIPQNCIIDGENIWPLISFDSRNDSPHKAFYYYFRRQLQAVRSGKWKLHLSLKVKQKKWDHVLVDGQEQEVKLFNLEEDPQENKNVVSQYPDVVNQLLKLVEDARTDLGDNNRIGKNQRPAGMVKIPKPLVMINE